MTQHSAPFRPPRLAELRVQGTRLALSVEDLPPSIDDAYGFAASTAKLLGNHVAAWKLGATTAATRRIFATEDIYFGALLDNEVWHASSGEAPPAPRILQGEAEIAFRLAVSLDPTQIDGIAERHATELFDAWAPAIECPYSCIENIPALGLRALLMDRCAAGALYLGAEECSFDPAAMGEPIEIAVDRVPVATGMAGTSLLMPPMEAALGFLRRAAAQNLRVERGQWISTGGITPCVPLPFDRSIQLNFGGRTIFDISVEAPSR